METDPKWVVYFYFFKGRVTLVVAGKDYNRGCDKFVPHDGGSVLSAIWPVAYAEICKGGGFGAENVIALSSPGNG